MKNGREKKELMLVQLLEDNNLIRKPISNSEGSHSLMAALSHRLRFSEEYSTQIQQTCVTHLKNLIKSGNLPPRLSKFHENESLWKQFFENPTLEEFEKTNLELVSLVFQVKVLVYHVSDDNSLMTTVINNKFEKLVELLKTDATHFEPLFNKKDLETNSASSKEFERSSPEEVDRSFDKVSSDDGGFKTLSSQKKLFFDLETKEEKTNPESSGPNTLDTQNVKSEVSPVKRPVFAKISVANKESDQISKTVEVQSSTPIQDSKLNSAQKKNAPIIRSNLKLSSNVNEAQKSAGIYSAGAGSSSIKKKAFFDEDLTTAEIVTLESHKLANLSQSEQMRSPIHFINSPPPGITPTRYQTKTYGTDESKIILQNRAVIPTSDSPKDVQSTTQISSQETDPLQSPGKFMQGWPAGKKLSLKTNISEESTQLNGALSSGPLSSQKSPNIQPKNKPIVLEEGYERFTGKLKFFDEVKNYGFIVKDDDGSDVFVHFDDLQKANLSKEILKTARLGNTIKLSFTCLKYIGKHDKSRKATDIQLII